MAMTVSMARALGLDRLAVPTQGNAGDALAEYAVAGKIEAAIVMSPDTDLPVLGKVAAYAQLLSPERPPRAGCRHDHRLWPAGAGVVRARAVTSAWPPFRSRAGEPRARKPWAWKWPSPAVTAWRERQWQLPDVIVYPTGGGTGVVGMAKAFDELEALGLVGPERPRMICVQSAATDPIVRAMAEGEADITPRPPGTTIATGLNVAQNVGHINVLRILRQTGGWRWRSRTTRSGR